MSSEQSPTVAQRPGDELDELLEAASATEIAPSELCLKIARAHDKRGDLDQAYAWLARVPDAADSFMAWSAASTSLARLTRRARPPARAQCRIAVTGSYTTSQLAPMLGLAGLARDMDLMVHEGLYGQYQQDLLDPASSLHQFGPAHIVVAVHEGALRLPPYSEAPEAEVAAEVDRWRRLWRAGVEHSGATVVQHNFAQRPEVPYGHLSGQLSGSRYAMIAAVNRELQAAVPDHVSIVDCDRLASEFGRDRWFDDRYWLRSKQAVALDALPLLALNTAAVIGARLGLARKCLVLDLDNTLWGGTIGEDGLEGIVLGGDESGAAFVAFQEYVLQLKERGVLLAIASKNNEPEAREVFERHPDMRIRLDDISMFAVNWEDKPANLRRIADQLGIGLDALVLADDNPAEREIVRRLVPEVDVIALPEEPADYRRALAKYLGFEAPAITREDRQRTAQYRARAAAAELASSASDIESFYRDLRMRAAVAPFDDLHMQRIAQLVVKTNQFNLTTRRHDIVRLRAFVDDPAWITRYLELSDRFTDHGVVAVAIAEIRDGALDIDTFLMSCRVIGRTVEAHLLMHLGRLAAERGCTKLCGTYVPTPKNAIVSDLYASFGFRTNPAGSDSLTRWEYDLVEQGPITSEFIEDSLGP